MKAKLFTLGALLLAGAVRADERGLPIFGDSFETVGTFAENWVSKKCTSANGVVKIPDGGNMHWRGDLPLEFVAEADVAVTPRKGAEKSDQVWGGLHIGNTLFYFRPNGWSFFLWRLASDQHTNGKYVKIPNFEVGKSVRLRVVRKVVTGGVKVSFSLNGAKAGDFVAPTPEKKKGADGEEAYEPLEFAGYSADLVVDNFLLSTVRHDDDSPNMVFNSGFEYGEDGIPTYYGYLGDFNYDDRPPEEYETRYLKRIAMDPDVKHSGKYSLRVHVNDASCAIGIRPWQTGTIKGQAGVFSVWMKSSVDGLPVGIAYSANGKDGHKIVNVTKEWARYEVTTTNLYGKGVYSPTSITPQDVKKQNAILWIDDLQAEVVARPPEGRFDPAKTYATPYKPSELDRDRFGKKEAEPPSPTLTAKKLPKGVKPTADLDAWTGGAEPLSFWMDAKAPRVPTAGWLACDDDNLYLGVRSYREDPKSLTREHTARDLMIYYYDGLELFFAPDPDKGYYHFMTTANGDQFDLYDNNIKWNGSWKTAARENKKAGSVDLLVTIPFADFAANGFTGRWRVNLCRNELSQKGAEIHASTAKHKNVGYKRLEKWNDLVLPADVAAKWIARVPSASANAKDTVLGRLDFYMNEPYAAWRVTGADGKVTVVKKPLAEIPMGTNQVTFTANGKTYTDTVVKLPFTKNATQVNRWVRCLVKNGENLLVTAPDYGSVGWISTFWWREWNPEKAYKTMMDIIQRSGFRYVAGLIGSERKRYGRDYQAEARVALDAIRAHGLQYMNWCDQGIDRWEGTPAKNRRKAEDFLSPEESVAFFRPYADIILTNLVIDEPELGRESDWTRRWLEYMKTFYPYLPVQMNNSVLGVPSRFADLKTDVLMLDDYLTNGEGRTVDSVVRQVDVMRAVPGGKPCWFFIVANNVTLHYKSPSYREQLAMSWGCLLAGCTGIAWYHGLPAHEGTWRAMKQVNYEAQALKDVILSEELCAPATVDQPKSKLRHLTRTLNGTRHVLACNIDAAPLGKVTFALPEGAPRSGTVEVLYENRTLPLKDGVFSDDFAPHTRHLYKIR